MIDYLVALTKRSIVCFCVSVVMFLFLLGIVMPAYAQSAFDVVNDRIGQDLSAIQAFYTNTEDENISQEDFFAEMQTLEDHLNESIEVYDEFGTFTDATEKEMQDEVDYVVSGITSYRDSLITFRTALEQQDPDAIQASSESLMAAEDEINQGLTKWDEQVDEFVKQDNQTELLYIGLMVLSAVVSGGLVIKYLVTKKADKKEAYLHLFKTSLAPFIGTAITLGTLEYAKYTGGETYTVVYGLIIVGWLYFLSDAGKYIFMVRPALHKKK